MRTEVIADDASFVLCDPCRLPLQPDFSRRGCEWWCPGCGRFSAFFDGGHYRTTWGKLSDEQKGSHLRTGRIALLQRFDKEGKLSDSGASELRSLEVE